MRGGRNEDRGRRDHGDKGRRSRRRTGATYWGESKFDYKQYKWQQRRLHQEMRDEAASLDVIGRSWQRSLTDDP